MNLVFDIGGTNMRLACAEETQLSHIHKIKTPSSAEEGLTEILAYMCSTAPGIMPRIIAGGVASRVSDNGVLSDAPDLPKWEQAPFAKMLTEACGASVVIVNDAAAAGLGEVCGGAGKGMHEKSFGYITVSTGVGAAKIIGNEIVESCGAGHVRVRGEDLRNLISGTAVKERFGIEPQDLGSLEIRDELADILAEGLKMMQETWRVDCFVLGVR